MVQAQAALQKAHEEKANGGGGGAGAEAAADSELRQENEELRAKADQFKGEVERLKNEALAKDEWMKRASSNISEITKEKADFVEVRSGEERSDELTRKRVLGNTT